MLNTSCGNTIGTHFCVTTFGESHGEALGAVIDGAPSNIPIDMNFIQQKVDERKPSKISGGTARKETDKVELLSGVFNGVTTGMPITLLIKNSAQHSADYGNLINTYRPGHADYTYDLKFKVRDYRGGGRSSGRETVARVAAGGVASLILRQLAPAVKIYSYTLSVAGVTCKNINFDEITKNPMRAPDNIAAQKMIEEIEKSRAAGDSLGGVVECIIKGVPLGLGRPVFDKVQALIAHAIFSIGAVKGLEFGAGFAAANSTGSVNNDAMTTSGGKVIFETNNAGGTLGGITTGDDIIFRVAIKPVPSIYKEQKTVQKVKAESPTPFDHANNFNLQNGENSQPNNDKNIDPIYKNTSLLIKGRHDVCLAPRVAPVIEAMAAIVLCDLIL